MDSEVISIFKHVRERSQFLVLVLYNPAYGGCDFGSFILVASK